MFCRIYLRSLSGSKKMEVDKGFCYGEDLEAE